MTLWKIRTEIHVSLCHSPWSIQDSLLGDGRGTSMERDPTLSGSDQATTPCDPLSGGQAKQEVTCVFFGPLQLGDQFQGTRGRRGQVRPRG